MGQYAYISKDQSEALKHYGVVGMKWGHRKTRPRAISLEGRARRVYARTFDTNQNYYAKKAAKKAKVRSRYSTMAGMNRSALRTTESKKGLGNKLASKTYAINENYYSKKQQKLIDRFRDYRPWPISTPQLEMSS